jgi:hypothetical protein
VSIPENIIVTVLVLLAPVGFVYSWYFYLKRMPWNSSGWRGRVTLGSLVLLSFAIMFWPITRITMPAAADWQNYAGVGEQLHWVDAGERVALRILLAALALSLFGRPRLILPIVVACVGTGLFWVFSNIP